MAELTQGREGHLAVAAVFDDAGEMVVVEGTEPAGARFEIGSITKVFTSLLLADMVLAGEVALDDPVAGYLPDGMLEGAPGVTLRQLARHTSGLARSPFNMMFGMDPANPYAGFDEAALLDLARDIEAETAPDEEWQYSNVGVALLGYALANAAGEDFQTLLLRRIVEPMGLGDTDFSKTDLVTAYAKGEETPPWDLAMLAPAGALVSSLPDMIAFGRLLAEPPERWRPHIELMAADPVDAMGNAKIGLGFIQIGVGPRNFYLHDGGTGGFSTALWVDHENDRGAVVLLNMGGIAASPHALWLLAPNRP